MKSARPNLKLTNSSSQGANFPFQSNKPSRPSCFRIFNDFRRGTSQLTYESLPRLKIDWVEIKGNHYGTWPTRQEQAILFNSDDRDDESTHASLEDDGDLFQTLLKQVLLSEPFLRNEQNVFHDLRILASQSKNRLEVCRRQSHAGLELDSNPTTPREYLTVMYDLLVLALQTEMTRVATFQTACEGVGLTDRFPSAIGLANSSHSLSQEKKNYAEVASYITFLNEMYSNFLKKIDSVQEGNSTLLDNTLCFYGCATSKTHLTVNYTIILSGGKNMEFKHGSHLHYGDNLPLSNLFHTFANQFAVPTDKFSDSTGDIMEVVA